ncbi:AI-2E family transporter [Dyadobacter tibetensis]|uniref:AI-2E family transporter n=1 Tax=Dyadobacter tibetensis TaxID=1211851 RepID=UPI00047142F5|nr:AI-2E family transporter [Dyadobacter tibetensis]
MVQNTVGKVLYYTVFSTVVLYFGRPLFIPLSYGLFLALLLYPLCRWMEARRLGRALAILLAMSLLVLCIGVIMFLLFRQIVALQGLWPGLKIKLLASFSDFISYLEVEFQISEKQGRQWIAQGLEKSLGSMFSVIGAILGQSVTSLVNLLLIPIYAYLILYYRTQFTRALTLLAPERLQGQMQTILYESVGSYVSFIKGMLTVYLIVGILNTIGLLALGIPQALLFGLIASILTFIPYVGIMIASLLPIAISWSLYDSIWAPLGVIGIYSFVQYLEANLIFPWAVGQRVNLNTLATLVVIVAGGIIWGASGMILFVPFAAIFRLVAEKIEGAEALLLLMGERKHMPGKVD